MEISAKESIDSAQSFGFFTKRVRFGGDSSDDNDDSSSESVIEKQIIIQPKFKQMINNNEVLIKSKLNENGCVCAFNVNYNSNKSANISALIYVRKSCLTNLTFSSIQTKSSKTKKSLNPIRVLKRSLSFSNKANPDFVIIKPFGVASLIYSIDGWKSWDTVEATYHHQTLDYLIYEATLMSVQGIIEDSKTIEFVACYQNDYGIVKDTNDDKCYTFQRVDRVIHHSDI